MELPGVSDVNWQQEIHHPNQSQRGHNDDLPGIEPIPLKTPCLAHDALEASILQAHEASSRL